MRDRRPVRDPESVACARPDSTRSRSRANELFRRALCPTNGLFDIHARLSCRVRRAVIPGRETLDYLPTQVIAEYLWSQAKPKIDGIVFGSAQITDSANNVVLFPNAASVEGADEDSERKIRYFHHHPARNDEDADEDEQRDRDMVTFEAPTGDDANAPARDPNDEDNWLAGLWEPVNAVPDLGPALRLGDNDVWRMRVDGIRYVTHPIQVEFDEWEEHGMF